MNEAARASREIDGKGRTVRELLSNGKYSIDYHEHEYRWQQKKLAEQSWNPDRLADEAQS